MIMIKYILFLTKINDLNLLRKHSRCWAFLTICSINILLPFKIMRDCWTKKPEMLDDSNCPAIDQKRREGRFFLS